MDKLRDQVLQEISVKGKAYTNEIKAMAEELIELRAKQAAPEPVMETYVWKIP